MAHASGDLVSLGYIGVSTRRPEDWQSFATRLLGMQQTDQGGSVRSFRMDDRRQRLIVSEAGEGGGGLGFLGWEAADAAALNRVAARLDAAGTRVQWGGGALAAQRHVKELICFDDPAGNRLEVFHGAEIATEPFAPSRPISGFHTGAQGMGHAVLNVERVEPLIPFYTDVLGFGISDYGLQPYALYFFHLVGGRHHSFAVVGSGRRSFHHFMVELRSLDDVGQGYDLVQLEPEKIAYTLGRHTNDYMTSFYIHSPDGFFVEYGWAGRIIDSSTWQTHQTFEGPSFWGHERLYLPDAERKIMRDMRLAAAARGVRALPELWNSQHRDPVVGGE